MRGICSGTHCTNLSIDGSSNSPLSIILGLEKPVKINNENNKQAIRIITYSSSSSAGAGAGAAFIPLRATNVSRSAAGLSLPPAGTVQPVLSAVHLAFSASVKFFGLLPSAPCTHFIYPPLVILCYQL